MTIAETLRILADGAKYDASCASSGAVRRGTRDGIGNSDGTGICHSYTPDGRCISLLKILLTNFCIDDCQYCVNRASSDVACSRQNCVTIQPSTVVAMGSTAARALLGPQARVIALRGRVLEGLAWSRRLIVTLHRSAVLRTQDEAARYFAMLVRDLTLAGAGCAGIQAGRSR